MFETNETVAWATKGNAFFGSVVESNERSSVVLVTSQSKGRKLEGKRVVVSNSALGRVVNGRAVVVR